MTRELILERLDATIKKLTTLKKEYFDYQYYVSEFDDQHSCGSVCCVVGWYPKWFPEVNIVYHDRTITINSEESIYHTLETLLMNYHGINYQLMKVLFYGRSFEEGDIFVSNNSRNSLLQVRKVFCQIRSLIADSKIDCYLKLDQHGSI